MFCFPSSGKEQASEWLGRSPVLNTVSGQRVPHALKTQTEFITQQPRSRFQFVKHLARDTRRSISTRRGRHDPTETLPPSHVKTCWFMGFNVGRVLLTLALLVWTPHNRPLVNEQVKVSRYLLNAE